MRLADAAVALPTGEGSVASSCSATSRLGNLTGIMRGGGSLEGSLWYCAMSASVKPWYSLRKSSSISVWPCVTVLVREWKQYGNQGVLGALPVVLPPPLRPTEHKHQQKSRDLACTSLECSFWMSQSSSLQWQATWHSPETMYKPQSLSARQQHGAVWGWCSAHSNVGAL